MLKQERNWLLQYIYSPMQVNYLCFVNKSRGIYYSENLLQNSAIHNGGFVCKIELHCIKYLISSDICMPFTNAVLHKCFFQLNVLKFHPVIHFYILFGKDNIFLPIEMYFSYCILELFLPLQLSSCCKTFAISSVACSLSHVNMFVCPCMVMISF